MSRASGSRSRDGCLNCRRRKRRCDESKPICFTCRRIGAECIYPVPGSASNPLRFVIATSPTHYIIHNTKYDEKSSFLHLFSKEMPSLCPGIGDTGIGEPEQTDLGVNCGGAHGKNIQLHGPIPRQLSQFNRRPNREALLDVETALMQYYAEVISSSRVYVQTDRNLFRTSVMPRVFLNQGPLYFTVLAMSAAEWGQNLVTDGRDYNALSARYKVQALHELQSCLGITESSEENLLTCVLLASMEISEGSRPTWLRHLQGALALLDNFIASIDPSVASFALQYFRFRYILMETTQPKRTPPTNFDEFCHDSYNHAMSRIAEVEYIMPSIHGSGNLVDEHIGCSMELVGIINQISALSLAAGLDEREMFMEQRYAECHSLEHRILQIPLEINDMRNEYLLKSAESFQIAAQIYLRATHLDVYTKESSISELHQKLLNYLSEIIVEGQTRRSFPMWPLFIAGCTCSLDEQRKTVLGLFTILDSQWPISNISAVWNAIRTVWHTRDLSTISASRKQDWQEIIHKFGWKLSLS